MTTTVDTFLTGLQQRVTYPTNQALLDTTAMLLMADKVTKEKMVPLMLSTNENFFVYTENVDVVVSQEDYDIPYRSIGRGLRDLKLVNSNQTANTYNMALIALEDEHLFVSEGIPTSFFFKGDRVILRPVPVSTTFYLKMFYNLQPNQLVPVSSAALVTSISIGSSTTTVTCTAVPSTFLAGNKADFIQGTAGNRTLDYDLTMQGVTGTQITFAAADVPSTLQAGDYITMAQQTPVIQLPDEACPLLETLVAIRVLYAVGDFDGANLLKADAVDQERDLLKILQPRIEGENTKIVNRNGLLRGRGFNYSRLRGGYYF